MHTDAGVLVRFPQSLGARSCTGLMARGAETESEAARKQEDHGEERARCDIVIHSAVSTALE